MRVALLAALFALAACAPAPHTAAPQVVASTPAPTTDTTPGTITPEPQPTPAQHAPPTTSRAPAQDAAATASPKPPAAAAKTPPARTTAAADRAPKPAAPKAPAAAARAPAPAPPPSATAATAPAPAPAARAAPLDLKSLEQRLRDTSAIGVMTKLSLKNQVDDLLEKFREYYRGELKTSLTELRHPYELLLMKVLSLLQDGDPGLARDINSSREAIWAVLSNREKFLQFA